MVPTERYGYPRFRLRIGRGAGERHCSQAKRDDEVAPPVALRRPYCADCN